MGRYDYDVTKTAFLECLEIRARAGGHLFFPPRAGLHSNGKVRLFFAHATLHCKPSTMSRTKSGKRKRDAESNASNKTPKSPSVNLSAVRPSTAAEAKCLSTLISDEELEITVDTLQTLADNPTVIKSKACKDLRAAVYDFRQACTTGVNTAGGLQQWLWPSFF
jgi:hypothetical protein